MIDPAAIVMVLRGEAEQEAFGDRLGRACGGGPLLVFLEGDLGAGKTTLVRGLVRGLGHRGAVKSPTYTLIEPYRIGDRQVYHLDLYRVADPDELEFLGLREILAEEAILLIEWPERGAGWLPPPDLRLRLRHLDDGRELTLDAQGARGAAVVARLRELL